MQRTEFDRVVPTLDPRTFEETRESSLQLLVFTLRSSSARFRVQGSILWDFKPSFSLNYHNLYYKVLRPFAAFPYHHHRPHCFFFHFLVHCDEKKPIK